MIIQNCLVELVTQIEHDYGYKAYVFKYLEESDVVRYNDNYIICTRYPNWNHREIKDGEIGFVEIEVVRAGIDTWFDGEKQVPYKNNASRFIKFIEKPNDKNIGEYIL